MVKNKVDSNDTYMVLCKNTHKFPHIIIWKRRGSIIFSEGIAMIFMCQRNIAYSGYYH